MVLVITNQLEFYFFLLYFVIEVLFVGILSIIKWFSILRSVDKAKGFSHFIGAILFMVLNLAIVSFPLLFLYAMAEAYNPYPEENKTIPFVGTLISKAPYLIPIAFIRVLIYHIGWVRNKKYNQMGLKLQFYMMLITGFGGLIVILFLSLSMDKMIADSPIIVASIFTIVVLAFEIWNEFDPKKWLMK